MKTLIQFRSITIFFFFSLLVSGVFGQTQKKERIRLNAAYVHVIDHEHYLNIKASARVNRKTVEVADAELIISQELEDGEIELGTAKTDARGLSKFVIEDFDALKQDEDGFYHLTVSFGGNDQFKRGSRDVSFRPVEITAGLVFRDSVNYLNAKLTDAFLDSAIAESPLIVQLDRLFRPLKIEKDFFLTDEEGEIAGFWQGLWHGLISPFTFLISLFSDTVHIYEIYNNGGWYNFGFLLGASIIFGGSSGGAARRRR